MEQGNMPKNKSELKEMIVEIVKEINHDNIPNLSDDEENELENLHGDSLDKPINKEDFEPL